MYNIMAEWKPIVNFPNYLISNNGCVFSLNRNKIMELSLFDGYKTISLLNNGIRKKFRVHRLVFQHFGTNWDENLTIDHINNIRCDNTIDNLRMATQQQQNFNVNVYKNNKLGIKGVNIHYGKYRARIRINNILSTIGTYETIEEASEAYKTKARELHGEFFKE